MGALGLLAFVSIFVFWLIAILGKVYKPKFPTRIVNIGAAVIITALGISSVVGAQNYQSTLSTPEEQDIPATRLFEKIKDTNGDWFVDPYILDKPMDGLIETILGSDLDDTNGSGCAMWHFESEEDVYEAISEGRFSWIADDPNEWLSVLSNQETDGAIAFIASGKDIGCVKAAEGVGLFQNFSGWLY